MRDFLSHFLFKTYLCLERRKERIKFNLGDDEGVTFWCITFFPKCVQLVVAIQVFVIIADKSKLMSCFVCIYTVFHF